MKTKLLSLAMVLTVVITYAFPFDVFANDETEKNNPYFSVEEAKTSEGIKGITKSTIKSTTKGTASKDEDNEKAREEAQKTLEQQQKELEENLAEAEKKLKELEKSSKIRVEYIDTLDRKIGYINEQLTILEENNTEIQSEIDSLKPQIEKNEKQLSSLKKEIDKSQKEIDKLRLRFTNVYEAYCYRLKVLYISGEFNIISALLSCRDISSLLTRYEMIKSIAKSDTQLLEEVNEKVDEITTNQNGLNERKSKFEAVKAELAKQKNSLVDKQKTIENNLQTIANKKASLALDRAESDRLLAELTAQNQQYTEFRNEDRELIEQVENEVQALIAGIKTAEEITTAVASNKKDTKKVVVNSGSDVYSKSDAVLNMSYPVPNHHGVSAGYPNYSSGQYHGGIDFPCPTGSRIVAAQKGIVVTVKRLDYSYGYYVMIYHGTDSKGRKVVSLYAHNSSILVSAGDSVKKGQQIAKSGSTGNSTGPHCHFEVRFDGERSNPKNYLS